MSVTKHVNTVQALQVAIISIPLVARFFQSQSALPFPPIGDDSAVSRFLAAILIAACVVVPYFMPNIVRRRPTVIVLFSLFLILVFTYRHFEGKYVVPLSDGQTFVVRGDARNPTLKLPYSVMDDQDLIEYAGARDADLVRVYTKESLESNRSKIYWSYVLSLIVLQLAIGSAAVIGKTQTDAHETAVA